MSKESTEKQSFLHGAALLAIAMVLVKIIGAPYKIVLNAVIGEKGFGYFNTAYQIYTVLLLISTAGLPVGMSRMISASSSAGHYREMRKVFRVCRGVFLTLGISSSVLMVAFAKPLAEFSHQPSATAAIIALGPCALLVCLLSTYRGFFQGQGNMKPTSISEVIEAIFKLFIGIAAAVIIHMVTDSMALAAAGAIFGVTIGAAVSAVYLAIRCHRDYSRLPDSKEEVSSTKAILKELMSVAIPITIGSAGLESLYIFETNLYMGQILALGHSQETADTMKGIYDMARTIYYMPLSFISPLTVAIIPAITAHLTLGEKDKAAATEESAARIAGLMATPCAVGLFVMSRPVMALLGGYGEENLGLAAALLSALGVGLYFYAVVQVTNTIMQANGHATIPVIHILIAGLLKLVVVYWLSGIPELGILGVPIGAALCNFLVSALNLIAMHRVLDHRTRVTTNFLRAVPAALIMGAVVFGCWWGLRTVLPETTTLGRLLLCGLPILVGVAVYAVAAVKLEAITAADCMLLPKGEKIIKILHIKGETTNE